MLIVLFGKKTKMTLENLRQSENIYTYIHTHTYIHMYIEANGRWLREFVRI